MGQFSITDAAFVGFRFARGNLRTIAIWAAIYLVFSIAVGLAVVLTAGSALMQIQAMGPRPDPSAALGLMQKLAPAYLVAILLALVFYAVLYATMSRAVLRPDEARFAYLRLGMDEVRQFLLFLLAAVVGIGVYIGFWIVVIIVAIASATVVGKGAAAIALTGVAVVAGFCAMIFLWVRLSLASPLTFELGRVNLFGSWQLTKGHFWRLFGCYLLVFFLMMVFGLLILAIYAALAMALGGLSGLGQLFRPDMTSVGAYFTPLRAAVMVIGAVASAMFWPVMLMPPVEIYAQLTEDQPSAPSQG